MTVKWPSDEAREKYIRFLELELRVMKSASEQVIDPELLGEFKALLEASFPRTLSYMETKLPTDAADSLTEDIRALAWAEARAVPGQEGSAFVEGSWTEREISEDINECFRLARSRAGL